MKNPLLVPELREYLAKSDFKVLNKFCASGHPAVIAEFMSALEPVELWQILAHVRSDIRAEVFSHLDEDLQVAMAETLRRDELAALVTDMAPDDRVDLLKRIPEGKKEALMPAMAQAEREDIRRLYAYAEGTAGSVMTSDYATISLGLTTGEAIAKLRREAPDKETIYYAYVVDENRRLIGLISLKDLILARPDVPVQNIMERDIIFARATEDREEAVRKIQKYDLIALPVVNGGHTLVGIITHDDAMDIIHHEFTEDMEKFMAISGDHAGAYLKTSAWTHFKNRCGWVVALAALGLVSGFIIQSFDYVLLQFTILATFIPMLAGAGGNTGSQSATLVVRALATKEITPADIVQIMFKELKVAIPMGITLAAVAFGRVFLQAGNASMPAGYSLAGMGMAIGTALGLQVITAMLIGTLLPLGVAKLRFDPAVVASPALASIVDITGMLIFFLTIKIMLGL